MNTARQHSPTPAPARWPAQPPDVAARTPGHRNEESTPPSAAPADRTQCGVQADTAQRAGDRARAARSVRCPCRAGPGVPCGTAGDHLARYLRAGQSGAISRQSLHDVIAGLDVIAPHALIQPPAERAAYTAGAETAGQVIRAQLDAGMTSGRIEASAESVLGGRSGHPTPASEAFYRGYGDIAATCTREARELEAGA